MLAREVPGPDELRVHYTLGRCYFELGRCDEAIGAWQSVNAIDPDFGQAYSGRVAAYFEKGDFDRAWTSVRECRQLGRHVDPTTVARLREASVKRGPE